MHYIECIGRVLISLGPDESAAQKKHSLEVMGQFFKTCFKACRDRSRTQGWASFYEVILESLE